MNPTPSPVSSIISDIDELDDFDDEDDDGHTIVELEKLLSPEYDADSYDHSTIDVRGSLKKQHAFRTPTPNRTSPKPFSQSGRPKPTPKTLLLTTEERLIASNNNEQQEKLDVKTPTQETPDKIPITVQFKDNSEKEESQDLEEQQKNDCLSSSIDEEEYISPTPSVDKPPTVQEKVNIPKSRRISRKHSVKQTPATSVSISQRPDKENRRSSVESDITTVILNLSTKLKAQRIKESQAQEIRQRKRSTNTADITITEPTTNITRDQFKNENSAAVISIEIRKSMSSLNLENNNQVDAIDESSAVKTQSNSPTNLKNNIATKSRGSARKTSNAIILPPSQSGIVEGHKLLPPSPSSCEPVHYNSHPPSPVEENHQNISTGDVPEKSNDHVVKFILSSFKNPMSPPKKERVQFKLSEGGEEVTVHANDTDCLSNSSLSRPCSVKHSRMSFRSDDTRMTDEVFITPRNSCISLDDDYCQPVSNITIQQPSNTDFLTSDESAVVSSSSSLLERLHRNRASRQKQRERHEKVQARRSCSSGYDTVSRDTFFESRNSMRSTSSSPIKERLSIKRGPLFVEETCQSNSDSRRRHSEGVYFDDYLPVAHPMSKSQKQPRSAQLTKTQQHVKIRNLEKKLSGQQHRYFAPKTEHQIEADRITLLMLQKKSGVKVPVKRTSSSIPNRCQFKLMKNISK